MRLSKLLTRRWALLLGVAALGCEGDDIGDEARNTTPADVLVTSNGAALETSEGLVTAEKDGDVEVALSLSKRPSVDVNVAFASSDETEGVVVPAEVTFTRENWGDAQTVTIQGVDDDEADGTVEYEIGVAITSSDLEFAALEVTPIPVSNEDDDTAGLQVESADGFTTEMGDATAFTVALTSMPTADVRIAVGSSDAGEGMPQVTELLFAAAEWDTPQSVEVLGVDDKLADGSVDYAVLLGPNLSEDEQYAALETVEVPLSNTDDDAVGVSVTVATELVTSELDEALSNPPEEIEIVLDSEPTADVRIKVGSSDPTEGEATPTEIVFTPNDWFAPHKVSVLGVNDLLADGDMDYLVNLTPESDDEAYAAVTIESVPVTNTDDDSVGVRVSEVDGLITSEDGTKTATFTIALASEPTAVVTIPLSSSAPDEASVLPTEVVFDSSDWHEEVTITVSGENDDIADGNQPFVIHVGAAVGGDYDGIGATDVLGTNEDDDVVGIVVEPVDGLVVSEDGSKVDTFRVSLTSEPMNGVDVTIPVTNHAEATTGVDLLTLTSANSWSLTVIVSAVDDNYDDDTQPFTIVLGVASGGDYDGLDASDVTGVAEDDGDTRGILVSQRTGHIVSEDGTKTSSFEISLNTTPVDDADVTLNLVDHTEATVSPSSVTLTSANNWTQTVDIAAVNDSYDDGDLPFTITLGTATATSGDYDGEDGGVVSGTAEDDADTRGINVTPLTGHVVSEDGTMISSFTVSLDTDPIGDAEVTIPVTNHAEATTGVVTVALNSANGWSQTIPVTGINDSYDDGTMPFTIVLGLATGGDYTDLDAADVSGNAEDDADTRGISVTPLTGHIVSEDGTKTSSFTVSLDSDPIGDADVTIPVTDHAQAIATPSTITLTASNNFTQTVNITAVNDSFDDGTMPFTIILGAASGADYAGLDAADVSGNAEDAPGDTRGFIVTPSTGHIVSEDGTKTSSFQISLSTTPVGNADVTIPVTNHAQAVANVAQILLTSSNNWTQTVNLSAVNDTYDDGTQPFTIALGVATGGDYTNRVPGNVSGSAEDDADTRGINVQLLDSGVVSEDGTKSSSFRVSLDTDPVGDATVTIPVTNHAEATTGIATITLNSANGWTQTIPITAVNDSFDDGTMPFTITLGTATGGDYTGIDADDVSGSAEDDGDTRGILVSQRTGHVVSEDGTKTSTFTVSLATDPVGTTTVTIPLSADPQATPSPAIVTLSAPSWSQTVTISAIDDNVDDGTRPFTFTLGPADSASGDYDGVNGGTITGDAEDDGDTRGILVDTRTGHVVSEDGTKTSTFTVSLATDPVGGVDVRIPITDHAEASALPKPIVLTSGNGWTRTVTITAVDDNFDDDTMPFSLTLGPASAGSGDYAGLAGGVVSGSAEDDDAREILVDTRTGHSVTEGGATSTFTVSLKTPPIGTSAVTIPIADHAEAGGTPNPIVLNAGNGWSQPVTITAEDDNADDGTLPFTLTLGPADSASGDYDGVNGGTVTGNAHDNDTREILVSARTNHSVTEGGATSTFTVSLKTTPTGTGTVTIPITDHAEAEGTANPIVLMASNGWSQSVTITAVDDNVDDGTLPFTLTLGPADSGSGDYAGVNGGTVSGDAHDNDTREILVSERTNRSVTEGGATTTVTVSLKTTPINTTTVTIPVTDHAEAGGTPNPIVLNAGNGWSQPLTITAVDDNVDDGTLPFTLTLGPADSGSGDYNGVSGGTVTGNAHDNDTREILVSERTGRSVTEGGATTTVTVSLKTTPINTTTVTIPVTDHAEAGGTPNPIVLNAGNGWSQPLTITAVDDNVDDGTLPFTLTLGPADSNSGDYNGVSGGTITGDAHDNDTREILVSERTNRSVTEGGATTTVTVSLKTTPINTTTVTIPVTDHAEAGGTPNPIVLNAGNGWSQPLTIAAVDDNLDDETKSFTLTLGPADSNSGDYNGVSGGTITGDAHDNDTREILVSDRTNRSVTEGGATTTVTVSLKTTPINTTTVTIPIANHAQATANPTTVSLNSGNGWSQPLTLAAVDDSVVDGPQGFTITLGAASGGDYTDVTGGTITGTAEDNDTPVVIVSPDASTATLKTHELGTTATFQVKLGKQPLNNVVIPIVSGDTTEGSVSPAELTFTPSSWSIGQPVTVTGLAEAGLGGDVTYTVFVDPPTSASDVLWQGYDPADVSVWNEDLVAMYLTASGNATDPDAGGGRFVAFFDQEYSDGAWIDLDDATLSTEYTGIGFNTPFDLSNSGTYFTYEQWENPCTPAAYCPITNAHRWTRPSGPSVLMSIDATGGTLSRDSANPTVSDAGAVAFETNAYDLDARDNNQDFPDGDIYVRDGSANELISVNTAGDKGSSGDSSNAAISAEGKHVVFMSSATGLDARISSAPRDEQVYLRDRQGGGTTELLSIAPSGTEFGNGYSYNPRVSRDGAVVAFASDANNLASPAGGGTNIIAWTASGLETMSINRSGEAAEAFWDAPGISGDGNLVAFVSEDSLMEGRDVGLREVYVRNRAKGVTRYVTLGDDATPLPVGIECRQPSISEDGRILLMACGDYRNGNIYMVELDDAFWETTTPIEGFGVTEDTLIRLEDLSFKPIRDITTNDAILCHSDQGLGTGWVSKLHVRPAEPMLEVTVSNGAVVEMGEAEPVLSGGTYKRAKLLSVGETIVCFDEDPLPGQRPDPDPTLVNCDITNIQPLPAAGNLYTIEAGGCETFFAEDVLVRGPNAPEAS